MKAPHLASPNSSNRIVEIGEILATGLMRVLAKKSSELPRQNGENSLDFAADQSGHPDPKSPENAQ